MNSKSNIVIIIARGEAVRNFVYSDFLKSLSHNYHITLLTNIIHPDLVKTAKPYVQTFLPLKVYRENKFVILFREILHSAHYRWIWTEAVKYYWGRHNERVKNKPKERIKLKIWRTFGYFFANRFMLDIGTEIERWLSYYFRPTNYFDSLYKLIQPQIVFNCSHIHGVAADLPIRVATGLGIKTAVFLFSWDNLTSRGRIFPNYNRYFVWTTKIKSKLLELYRGRIKWDQVHVSGTPQFDFHFKPELKWTKEKLSEKLGLNTSRPFILYTTGMASDFPFEDKIVDNIIKFIKSYEGVPKPQLIVRTYVKGTSNEMLNIAKKYSNDNDIFFPEVMWDKKWTMPYKEDVELYSNILRHITVGINTASTVSLELMIFGKHAINIGFEPPGSDLPSWTRFSRHVDYEHYLPVVRGGGVKVAKSMDDLFNLIIEGLKSNGEQKIIQRRFLSQIFGLSLDFKSYQRIVNGLLQLKIK